MFDQITTIENGVIHHGEQNKRIYVMKAPTENMPRFFTRIEDMAGESNYEKIVAKIPFSLQDVLLQRGYECEASIPAFYKGEEDCCLMSKFLKEDRRNISDEKIISDVLMTAKGCIPVIKKMALPEGMLCRRAGKDDAESMTVLYRQVFASYPFPIHQPEYIVETMDDNVIYHGIWQHGKLIALASSELDRDQKNAEMTDFAVNPDHRGQNLSSYLLQQMEKDLRENESILTLYTIARAASHGMNCTFAKNGYKYSGTLVNNTQIAGKIESMNIWYKKA